MQTQRDHVHAHTFMMGRLGSALVEGDPTSAKIPGKRPLTGLIAGIVVAVLIVGGFGVYGWLVPGGSTAYKQPGTIVVEKETGTRYVYLKGVLYPTANLTSAMLLEGSSATVKLVSRSSLKDVPHGPEIGITDAPQEPPAVGGLVAGPWLACLPGSVTDHPGTDALGVDLDPRARATALASTAFTVVGGPDGTTYLVTGGHKYPVGGDAVLVALGAANTRVVTAPSAWLDWLPTGVTLAPPVIPHAGSAGPRVGGHDYPVGTLFQQPGVSGGTQLYVLRTDGLAAIDRTDFLLAQAAAGGQPVTLTAAQVVAAPRSADRSLTGRLPDLTRLHVASLGNQVLCVRQRPVDTATVSTQVVLADRLESGVASDGTAMVLAAPSTGMAVTPVPKQGATTETVLISDQGTAFELADSDTVSALGLGGATPVPFPRTLLAALPQGPALSRTAAVRLAGRQ
jgi:ESX secretion system ATPase EccB